MNGSKSLPIQVARKDLKKEGWNERGGLKHIIKTYYPVKPPDIAKCEVAKRTVPSASASLLLLLIAPGRGEMDAFWVSDCVTA